MNFTIAFFVGCITLAVMMLVKIPIKYLTRELAERSFGEKDSDVLYKRYNLVVIVLVFVMAIVIYYFVLQWLGESHFKLCCSMKAGIISLALYSVFERFL